MSVQTGLDSHHEQQMQDFVNMSKDRRSRTKKEISSTIQAFIDEEVSDDFYSRDDLCEQLIPLLEDRVAMNLDGELDQIWRSMGVLLKQLFTESSAHQLNLTLHLDRVEDQREIQAIRSMELSPLKKPSTKLPSLGGADSMLLDKINKLQEENAALQQQVAQKGGAASSSEQRVADLTKQLENLKVESERRLQEQKQFVMLQNMLKAKNEQIKKLRAEMAVKA